MDNKIILMVVVSIILGMLVANMFKDVCGCKNLIEGQCGNADSCIWKWRNADGSERQPTAPETAAASAAAAAAGATIDPTFSCDTFWDRQGAAGYSNPGDSWCSRRGGVSLSVQGGHAECCADGSTTQLVYLAGGGQGTTGTGTGQTVTFNDQGCLVVE